MCLKCRELKTQPLSALMGIILSHPEIMYNLNEILDYRQIQKK